MLFPAIESMAPRTRSFKYTFIRFKRSSFVVFRTVPELGGGATLDSRVAGYFQSWRALGARGILEIRGVSQAAARKSR